MQHSRSRLPIQSRSLDQPFELPSSNIPSCTFIHKPAVLVPEAFPPRRRCLSHLSTSSSRSPPVRPVRPRGLWPWALPSRSPAHSRLFPALHNQPEAQPPPHPSFSQPPTRTMHIHVQRSNPATCNCSLRLGKSLGPLPSERRTDTAFPIRLARSANPPARWCRNEAPSAPRRAISLRRPTALDYQHGWRSPHHITV